MQLLCLHNVVHEICVCEIQLVMQHHKARRPDRELNEKAEVNADMSQLCLQMGDIENAELYACDSIHAASTLDARAFSVSSRTTAEISTDTLPPSTNIAGRARQLAESSLVMSRVFQAKQRCVCM